MEGLIKKTIFLIRDSRPFLPLDHIRIGVCPAVDESGLDFRGIIQVLVLRVVHQIAHSEKLIKLSIFTSY